MTAIQLLAVLAAAVLLFTTYTALRRRELRGHEFGFWAVIWGGLIAVSLFADRFRGIIVPLQVARLLDLVMIVGLVALGGIVLGLNRTVRRLENRLTAIVREVALERSRDEQAGTREEC